MDKNEQKEMNVQGMVNQMSRITGTLSVYKGLVIICIVALVIEGAGLYYMNMQNEKERMQTIFVLDNGATFSASAQNESVSREDEVRHHVETFHRLMFDVAPSNEMIKRNLEAALYLADQSAFKYYNDLQETGFYSRLTSTNSFQQIDIQEVKVDMSVYPYQVMVRGEQYLTRETNITKYSFVSRCQVANSVRSKENLHGLMIERFEVIENDIIETRKK